MGSEIILHREREDSGKAISDHVIFIVEFHIPAKVKGACICEQAIKKSENVTSPLTLKSRKRSNYIRGRDTNVESG